MMRLTLALCVLFACGDGGSSQSDGGNPDGTASGGTVFGTWTVAGGDELWPRAVDMESAVNHQGTIYAVVGGRQLGLLASSIDENGLATQVAAPMNFDPELFSFGGTLYMVSRTLNAELATHTLVGETFTEEGSAIPSVGTSFQLFEYESKLHLAYKTDDFVRIAVRDGTEWTTRTDIGSNVARVSVAVVGTSLYAMVVDGQGKNLRVFQWNGTNTTELAAPTSAGELGIGHIGLAATSAGELYALAAIPETGVYRLQDGSWETLFQSSENLGIERLDADGNVVRFVVYGQEIHELKDGTTTLISFREEDTGLPQLRFEARLTGWTGIPLTVGDTLWFVYDTNSGSTRKAFAASFAPR